MSYDATFAMLEDERVIQLPGRHQLTLHQGLDMIESKPEDKDETGAFVWAAAEPLIRYLLSDERKDKWDGARVLEVGAGTGVVGLALAKFGAKGATLTHVNAVQGMVRLSRRRPVGVRLQEERNPVDSARGCA